MKILVLAAATYADPHTRKLFDHVAARGHEVILAMPRRIKHPFAPAEVPDTPWPTPGVRFVKLDTWYLHENGTHILMKGVRRLIREEEPDVIHCEFEPWSLTCIQVLGVIRSLKPRPRFGLRPCETKPEQGSLVARWLRQMLYRRTLAQTDYLVAWSTPIARTAMRMQRNGTKIIPGYGLGIDCTRFRPATPVQRAARRAEVGATPDSFVVGYTGRLAEDKGILDLVQAMDQVTCTCKRAMLFLLGAGPLEDELRDLCRTRPWLKVLEPRARDGVACFLQLLDILVLPSRTTPQWEEQFGLVLTEAMSCGTPVVGSESGAIPEVVQEGGWLFLERDIETLGNLITRLALNPVTVHRRGLLARERAQRLFSCEAVAEAYDRLWSHE